MLSEIIADIHTAMRQASGRFEPYPETRYHKHREYLTYGLSAPEFRRILKLHESRIESLNLTDRLKLARQALEKHIGELGHTAIWIISSSVAELTREDLVIIEQFPAEFRSWSHVDHFCGNVMQPLLQKFPQVILKILDGWTRSPIRWKRRGSVVVFTRSVARSGEFTDITLEYCERLIWDSEDIVRKGVGWALKDTMKSDRPRIIDYIKNLRRRGVSSTITLYAIRDVKGAERAEIMKIRKGKDDEG